MALAEDGPRGARLMRTPVHLAIALIVTVSAIALALPSPILSGLAKIMEASSHGTSSAPFFGSVIFSFDSHLNRPRIHAHISVLFIDEDVDDGNSSAPPEFVPPRDEAQKAKLALADKGKAAKLPNPQLERNQCQLVAVMETEGKVQEREYYRPCLIVEEEP